MNDINWKSVIAEYEAIRRQGQVNMFDYLGVQRITYENNLFDLVNAIQNSSKNYRLVIQNYNKYIKEIKEEDIPKIRKVVTKFVLDDIDEEEGQ